jgi:carboxypeptidase Taq
MSSAEDYQIMHYLSRHAQLLSSTSQLLELDQETYMPPDADGIRCEQIKILAGLTHHEKTSSQYLEALEKLIDVKSGKIVAEGLSDAQNAALKRWRRDYIKESALPKEFVEEFAQLTSQSLAVWRKARKEQSFEQFAPFLDKIVTMCRKKADYLTYDGHPYDALLDLYEPQVTTVQVAELFSSLEKDLSELLKKVAAAPQVDDSDLFGEFDHKKQLEFGLLILNAMGYVRTKGRLDISTHPFSTSLHPTDTRITTRIHASSLMSNISSVMHEGGHALYDMGLPVDQFGSPLCQAISYGMHESQSRWWETRIGKSKAFWQHYLPHLQQYFPGPVENLSLDNFYKAINKVQPSLIRTEADELSYPLHIILRFQLERSLIDGSLTVRDIPEAWNAKMQELIGLTPQNNSEGCLQDVHWALGSLGYFPSYAIGNAYASHLFLAFAKQFPDWEQRLATGDLLFIKTWLNENVHRYGRQYSALELMEKVTEKPFTSQAYLDYLTDKYSDIYLGTGSGTKSS